MSPRRLTLSLVLATILVFGGGFLFFQNNALAAAGINKQINFQGKVTNTDGTNVANMSYDFTFTIYDADSGGTVLWTETRAGMNKVNVVDGIFQVNLGSVTPLPGSINFNSDNIYLGINFNGNGEMAPRIRFTATPYAMNAAKVGGLTVTDTTGTLTIPNAKTVQFADAFATTGAFPVTLNATASTSVTLPTSGTLMANPMVAQGDIIYGGASGVPTALTAAAGFLKCSGIGCTPAWSSVTASDVGLGNVTNNAQLVASTSSTQNGYFGDLYLYDDSTPSNYLQITNSGNLTGVHLLNLNTNNADRTISLSGDLTVSSAATVSGTNTGDQTLVGLGGVPTTRSLTINGTAQDLSADRTWTITTITGNAGTATTLQTARNIGGVSFNGSADITVASATGGFTVSGGALALGTNNMTMTGSLATTGSRVTKGWFTDIESTNMPTVGGTSLSLTFAGIGQTMYIGTTAHALNRASAAEGLSGITGLTPGADFSLTQNSVAALTSVESGAVANTLYLRAGSVGVGLNPASTNKLDVLNNIAGSNGIYVSNTGTGTTTGGYFSVTNATIGYGLQVAGMGNATSTGLAIGAMTGATSNTGITIGAITAGGTSYGINMGGISITGSGNNVGINVGNISTTTGGNNTGLAIGTISGTATANTGISLGQINPAGTSNSYGLNLAGFSNNAGAGITYGINIGANTATGTQAYGIKIAGPNGTATYNYGLDITRAYNASSTHNATLELGTAATTTGTWALYSSITDASYFEGNLTLGGITGNNDTLAIAVPSGGAGHFVGTLNNLDLTATRTWTLPNNSGIIPLGTAGNDIFFTTSGATGVTLPTSGTLVSSANNLSVFASTTSAQLAGVLSDENVTNGFMTNPMTTQGDLIVAGASGVPARLAGSTVDGYVLKYNLAGNTMSWQVDQTGAGGGYAYIYYGGGNLPQQNTLAFLGTGVSCADGTGRTECTINSGGGGVSLAPSVADAVSGANSAIFINHSGTGSLVQLQNAGTNKFVVANNGGVTVNGSDSSIAKNTTSGFNQGTVGSNLTSTGDRIQLSDGTPANSGQGTITTASQPTVDAAIGAGAMSITRPDGKYLVVKGGGSGATSLYDPIAGTFTNSQTIVCNGTTTVGVGALALPRANGMYTLICGTAGSTTTATSNVDPTGTVPSTIGPALATNAVTGAGTVAFKRPNGKYLVTVGASTPGVTTQIFDPVANTFTLGPPATGLGNWSAGALAIPLPDGRALFVSGGSTSTTAIYNSYSGSATIGAFTGAGPSLDGNQASGTCGINGAGSVAIKRQDGRYVILSKATVEAIYDPSANTMTCKTGVANVAALGDGAHAIPIQNGKFLILAGGNTTTAFVYNQDADTFSTYTGTAPTAVTTGAHSIMRPDGSWQIINGGGTATNNFSTNLPMSDPFAAPLTATVNAGAGCSAGNHSYYTTFVIGGVESELGMKSNVVSCSAASGTVALTNIPLGPAGTTARNIYRTTAGDVGIPQLVTNIANNTATTYSSDTLADGSLGAAYSVTPESTWYTSEPISNNFIGIGSTLEWTAQLEATYAAMRNQVTNEAFRTIQFYVRTATNTSTCAASLASAPWQEIQNSGDSIRAAAGSNCAQVSVHFNRAMPKKLMDDRGTWTGNNSTVLRYDYTTPTLFDFAIDNSAVMKKTSFDFSTPDSGGSINGTVPAAPTLGSYASGGSCNGTHYYFVSYVINGSETQLSPVSAQLTCNGGTQSIVNLNITTGPSGTTARKIYRVKSSGLVTDTPFYVGTQNDNSATTFADNLADASLGAAYTQLTPSGPTLSRGESTRAEVTNNQLTLPWGRISPTTGTATTGGLTDFYMGAFGSNHPLLNNLTGMGTTVIARDDKTFLVIEGGVAGGAADLYDPATQTFVNQTGAGDKPNATVGSGAFSIKRPNGKFLVYLGTGATTTTCTTAGTATNIYDQYAVPGSRFTNGPCLTAAGGQGAFAIPNADGTFTILHGNAATTTTLYDPVRNTTVAGPLQTTGTNYGALAIPLMGPNANIFKIYTGNTLGGAVATTTMAYNANSKIFTAGAATTAIGSGAFAFQRPDGFWVLMKGESAAGVLGQANAIINPYTGLEAAGTAVGVNSLGRGSHVIPRADGTFLIVGGNINNGNSVLTYIYIPWGGAYNATAGTYNGSFVAGPAIMVGNGATAPATLATGALATGTNLGIGAYSYKYTYVANGAESLAGLVSATVTTTSGNQAVNVTVTNGPTGTTAKRIYRTVVGGATTGPWRLVGTINDNTTTLFADTVADASLGTATAPGGIGDGSLSFQRPDGKFITIFGGASGSTSATINMYDAGWYADGQYLSEQMQVPALATNSTLDWQQTSDQYVRMAARTATTQAALGNANYNPIANPGASIGNAGGETWAQVQVNFRRDFPTFSGNLNGVYNSSGGMAYAYRPISIPTVNSYQITNGQDLLTLQTNGNNMLRVTSNGNIMSSSTGGFFTGGADLAENYTSNDALQKGEIVAVDATDSHNVKRSSQAYQGDVMGVVSTAPGFVAGAYTDGSYPIALVGRVPVNVSTQNGMIQAGDRITAASTAGYGMRATTAGRVIGTALESMDLTKLKDCPAANGIASDFKCGQINVFVNLADYQGMPVQTLMSEMDNNSLTMDTSSETINTTDPNSPFANYAPQAKVLNFLETLKDTQAGKNASDILAGNVNAINQVVSPLIVTDTLIAKNIKAENIEGLQFIQTGIQTAQNDAQSATTQVTDLGKEISDLKSQILTLTSSRPVMTATVVKDMETSGALTIGGPAEFRGPAVFKALAQFIDKVVFKNDVAFEGQVTFNQDTAGYATVKEGNDNVVVTFAKEYATPPIINANLSLQQISNTEVRKASEDLLLITDARFIITNVTTKGFQIKVAQKALSDIPFSWTAIAVKDAKTFEGAENAPAVVVLDANTGRNIPAGLYGADAMTPATDTTTPTLTMPAVFTPSNTIATPTATDTTATTNSSTNADVGVDAINRVPTPTTN